MAAAGRRQRIPNLLNTPTWRQVFIAYMYRRLNAEEYFRCSFRLKKNHISCIVGLDECPLDFNLLHYYDESLYVFHNKYSNELRFCGPEDETERLSVILDTVSSASLSFFPPDEPLAWMNILGFIIAAVELCGELINICDTPGNLGYNPSLDLRTNLTAILAQVESVFQRDNDEILDFVSQNEGWPHLIKLHQKFRRGRDKIPYNMPQLDNFLNLKMADPLYEDFLIVCPDCSFRNFIKPRRRSYNLSKRCNACGILLCTAYECRRFFYSTAEHARHFQLEHACFNRLTNRPGAWA